MEGLHHSVSISGLSDILLSAFQFAIVFGLGMLCSYLLLKKHSNKTHSIDTNELSEIELKRQFRLQQIAFELKKVVRDFINSKYVLIDKDVPHSIMQTSLRQNLHQLRSLSDRVLHESQPNANEVSLNAHCCAKPSKPSSNRANYTVAEVEKAIDFSITEIKKLFPLQNIEIKINTAIQGRILLQLEWFIEAIKEIVFNAIKHNGESVKISLWLNTDNRYLSVQIRDNGKGISSHITETLKHNMRLVPNMHRRSSDVLEHINLFSISRKIQGLAGYFDIRSAKKFGTTVQLSIPLVEVFSCDDSVFESNADFRLEKSLKINELNGSKYQTHSTEYIDKPRQQNIDLLNKRAPRVAIVSTNELMQERLLNVLENECMLVIYRRLEELLGAPAFAKTQCVIVDTEPELCNEKNASFIMQCQQQDLSIPIIMLGSTKEQIGLLQHPLTMPLALLDKPIVPELLKKTLSSLMTQKAQRDLYVEEAVANALADKIDSGNLAPREQTLFLNRFIEVLEKEYTDESFLRPSAAEKMAMSEKTLARKLSKYTDMTFTEYLKKFRLIKAKQKILNGEKVTYVAFDTGFSSPSYFTQCFRAEYGFAPSMLAKKVG